MARSSALASGPNGSAAIMRGVDFTRPSSRSSVQPFQMPESPSLYALGTTGGAAYAAVEARWWPVEEIVRPRAPMPTAWLTAVAQSRSLYDQVGFRVSSLA